MIIKIFSKEFDYQRLSALLVVEAYEDDGITPYPILVCYDKDAPPAPVVPPSGTHSFTIYPSRKLTAVASPDDLQVYTSTPDIGNGLYLSSTVHRYCLSINELKVVVDFLKADFYDLAQALLLPIPNIETITI